MEKVEKILQQFKEFYGNKNIVVNSLADDEDVYGGKIERTEIIINNKESLTIEKYSDGEIDMIMDGVKINKNNIALYYEFYESLGNDISLDEAKKLIEEQNSHVPCTTTNIKM